MTKIDRWLRRKCLRFALRGCKKANLECSDYVRKTISRDSLEDQLQIENALELYYWVRKFR